MVLSFSGADSELAGFYFCNWAEPEVCFHVLFTNIANHFIDWLCEVSLYVHIHQLKRIISFTSHGLVLFACYEQNFCKFSRDFMCVFFVALAAILVTPTYREMVLHEIKYDKELFWMQKHTEA